MRKKSTSSTNHPANTRRKPRGTQPPFEQALMVYLTILLLLVAVATLIVMIYK